MKEILIQYFSLKLLLHFIFTRLKLYFDYFDGLITLKLLLQSLHSYVNCNLLYLTFLPLEITILNSHPNYYIDFQ